MAAQSTEPASEEEVCRFTAEQVKHHGSLSQEEGASYLATTLQLGNHQTEARAAARTSYYTYALLFAKEAGYEPNSTASLMEVAHILLEAVSGGSNLEQLQALFKTEMLSRTSPKPGPDSTKFSSDQVAAIAEFFTRTFFKHWRLYSHCLQRPQDVTDSTVDLMVETPWIPSFDAALPEDEWLAAVSAAEQARAAAAAEAAAAEEAAAQQKRAVEEAAAAEELEKKRQEQLARKPATLEEAVDHLVALRLDSEKKVLANEYGAREEVLLKRIAELENQGRPGTAKK